MFSLRTLRTLRITRSRFVHVSPAIYTQPGKDPQLSQGSVSQPSHNHPNDPQDQAARAAQSKEPYSSFDAATSRSDMKAPRGDLSGNPENIGFADQVGSQSATAAKPGEKWEGVTGQEEITPPGLLDAVKSSLGMGTTAAEAKQNRGGGKGVAGAGSPMPGQRALHISAVASMAGQNPYRKHEKGNAATFPRSPSYQCGTQKSQQKRTFFTSAPFGVEKHSAEVYAKDEDVETAAPPSSKVHQVDASATGADVQRPDTPITGEFSQAGTETKEYETVSKEEPYDVPPSSGEGKEQKLRYGGTGGLGSGDGGGDSVSKPEEGPEGASKGGRKPEGKA